jgi:ATP-dependent DNA helicase RecG
MLRVPDHDIRAILARVRVEPSEQVESEIVEFKAYRDENALHNSKDLAEELSALANLHGGVVIVGVKDSSDVAHDDWAAQLQGIPDVDVLATKERIAGKLRPAATLDVRTLLFDGKAYVAIEIEKSYESLVSTASGKVCIRDGRSSRPMTPDEIERAVKKLTRYDWSNDCLPQSETVKLDDSSVQEALADFRQRRALDEPLNETAYLEAIGATQNGVVTRGGLLFLGASESIRAQLGDFEFRFTWKKPNGELLVNDIWSANLWRTVRRAESHFEACNFKETFTSGGTSFEVPLLDDIAFHEAYLNALVHRDYSVDGMTSVTYSGQELRIHSPGTFFGGVTSANIARHQPRHRNKNLARILMNHNFVDRAGMGVLRMGLGSLRYGRAFPEFREESDAVEVKMEAKFLRPGIAVLGIQNRDQWGIPELLILNSVYERGAVPIQELEARLDRLLDSPLQAIETAVKQLLQVELCGSRDGVFVRVLPDWKAYLAVEKTFRIGPSSSKYVDLFLYLRAHGQASNADLTELLGYNHSSQTSKFLRETKFVQRFGSGPSARWRIVEAQVRADAQVV